MNDLIFKESWNDFNSWEVSQGVGADFSVSGHRLYIENSSTAELRSLSVLPSGGPYSIEFNIDLDSNPSNYLTIYLKDSANSNVYYLEFESYVSHNGTIVTPDYWDPDAEQRLNIFVDPVSSGISAGLFNVNTSGSVQYNWFSRKILTGVPSKIAFNTGDSDSTTMTIGELDVWNRSFEIIGGSLAAGSGYPNYSPVPGHTGYQNSYTSGSIGQWTEGFLGNRRRVLNYGHQTGRISDIESRSSGWITESYGTHTILWIGNSDISDGTDLNTMQSGYINILNDVVSVNKTPIIIESIPQNTYSSGQMSQLILWNSWLDGTSVAYSGIFVGTSGFISNPADNTQIASNYDNGDGLVLNSSGYRKVAQRTAQSLIDNNYYGTYSDATYSNIEDIDHWYKFHEASGSIVHDIAGDIDAQRSNNIYIDQSGIPSIDSVSGYSFSFNDDSSNVININAVPTIASGQSYECWFNVSTTERQQYLFSFKQDTSHFVESYIAAGGQLVTRARIGGTGNEYSWSINSSGTIEPNKNYHFLWSLHEDPSLRKLYINGEDDTYLVTTSSNGDSNARIGNGFITNALATSGRIDEFVQFGRALSAAEAQNRYLLDSHSIVNSGSVETKESLGTTDTSQSNGVYKFMGASLIGLNSTLGFNSSASTLSINLVEDTTNGDSFTEPSIPSVHAVSLPSGGIGVNPLDAGGDLDPDAYNPNKYYFCGVCTSWTEQQRNIRGRTISVNLSDPRELMGGVLCLLNGFSLSQSIGNGSPRYTGVENIIDVFGYYNYGMESNKNEFGMEWSKIKNVLENVSVAVNDIEMEFYFTGTTFNNVPDYYRIDAEVIDLLSLIRKVATDGGSDFLTVARKVSSSKMVVEIRGIRRTSDDVAKKTEIDEFVTARSGIVEYYDLGKEYRPEPTSSVIVGGAANSNYVALPSTYVESMHLTNGQLDYNAFPDDIKERLLTGTGVDAGAIFPFWGFAPNSTEYPMIEPYISFDHIALDFDSGVRTKIKESLPQLKIGTKTYEVRQVNHDDMFLTNDGDSDYRPFGYVQDIKYDTPTDIQGYIRGLPLNTEVLKFALVNEDMFWHLYSLYFPEVANSLELPTINFAAIEGSENLADVDITKFIDQRSTWAKRGLVATTNLVSLATAGIVNLRNAVMTRSTILFEFKSFMYRAIKKYAEEHLGRQFMVVLPYSNIMNRIWNGLPVPTRPERPEIEYNIDSYGFWANTPTELDGFQDPSGSATFTSEEELEIRRRFMAEDGRFQPMVAIDLKPQGNAGFMATGNNRALFQDVNESDFRPNRIANKNDLPPYVFVSPSRATKLSDRRPDMALITLPNAIQINPTDTIDVLGDSDYNIDDDPTLINKQGIHQFLLYHYKKSTEFQVLVAGSATLAVQNVDDFATAVIKSWSDKIHNYLSKTGFKSNLEFVMDLKGVVLPLTSTWVTYGPWYANSSAAKGKVNIVVDSSLVPWNFAPAGDGQAAIAAMNAAGTERLNRTISVLEYLDKAKVTVAGFPEYSLGQRLGFNSNITSINVNFGLDGIRTSYNFSSFASRPGTFRKSDFDELDEIRIDTRPPIVETENLSLKLNAPGFRDGGFSYNTDRFY